MNTKVTRVKIRTAATKSFLQVTSIYCLLGLALISMGISLASEQVKHFKKETLVINTTGTKIQSVSKQADGFLQVKIKLEWFAYSTGMKEDEEAVMR